MPRGDHAAQLRPQCGERIVRHLRTRIREACLHKRPGVSAAREARRTGRTRSVLFPTLGAPTRPTSATALSSSSSGRVWPSTPASESSRCEPSLDWSSDALPRPPRPPRATTAEAPASFRSASRRSVGRKLRPRPPPARSAGSSAAAAGGCSAAGAERTRCLDMASARARMRSSSSSSSSSTSLSSSPGPGTSARRRGLSNSKQLGGRPAKQRSRTHRDAPTRRFRPVRGRRSPRRVCQRGPAARPCRRARRTQTCSRSPSNARSGPHAAARRRRGRRGRRRGRACCALVHAKSCRNSVSAPQAA